MQQGLLLQLLLCLLSLRGQTGAERQLAAFWRSALAAGWEAALTQQAHPALPGYLDAAELAEAEGQVVLQQQQHGHEC